MPAGILILILGLVPWNVQAQSQREMALNTLRSAEEPRSFQASILVETREDNGNVYTHEFSLYTQDGKEILRYQAPVRDRGKLILQIEGSYWMYFPAVRRSLVLSPIGALAGSVSNGDLLQPPLLTLYTVSDEAPSQNGITLTLNAKDSTAPYGRIVTEFRDGKMQTANYFSRSGILVKQAEYLDHTDIGRNDWIATEVLITSPLEDGQESTIKLSNPEERSFPPAWFNPNNLGNVR